MLSPSILVNVLAAAIGDGNRTGDGFCSVLLLYSKVNQICRQVVDVVVKALCGRSLWEGGGSASKTADAVDRAPTLYFQS
jgi:hypothetical protein